MEVINRIKTKSIFIFIVPVVVLNFCLFISTNYLLFEGTFLTVDQIGRSGFTIPYIDGGLSISRSARTYPSYLIFKPGMIITAILLIQYWLANNKLIKKINNDSKNKYFLFFGVGSAVFLILHSIFLGINFENDLYKLSEKLNINKDKVPHIVMYSRKNYKTLDEDSSKLIKNYNQFDIRLYNEFKKNK